MGWRGAHAHDRGEAHEDATRHVVWYDEDPTDDCTEDREGPVTWEPEGSALQTAMFR